MREWLEGATKKRKSIPLPLCRIPIPDQLHGVFATTRAPVFPGSIPRRLTLQMPRMFLRKAATSRSRIESNSLRRLPMRLPMSRLNFCSSRVPLRGMTLRMGLKMRAVHTIWSSSSSCTSPSMETACRPYDSGCCAGRVGAQRVERGAPFCFEREAFEMEQLARPRLGGKRERGQRESKAGVRARRFSRRFGLASVSWKAKGEMRKPFRDEVSEPTPLRLTRRLRRFETVNPRSGVVQRTG